MLNLIHLPFWVWKASIICLRSKRLSLKVIQETHKFVFTKNGIELLKKAAESDNRIKKHARYNVELKENKY